MNAIPDAARTAPTAPPKPATQPARPAVPAAKITSAPAKKPPAEDRTVVGNLPGPKDDDADFTSIIDKLGE